MSMINTELEIVAPEGQPVMELRRFFKAPPELVFRALTEGEFLRRWWGPRRLEIVSCEVDARVGGGWRIVHTMGSKITRLTPMQGCCAETAGAITLFWATWLGIPVSTTHTITGSIVGVGASRRMSAVRWNVASSIVYAWVITIPASALVAAATYWAVLLLVLR